MTSQTNYWNQPKTGKIGREMQAKMRKGLRKQKRIYAYKALTDTQINKCHMKDNNLIGGEVLNKTYKK